MGVLAHGSKPFAKKGTQAGRRERAKIHPCIDIKDIITKDFNFTLKNINMPFLGKNIRLRTLLIALSSY
jgi:hypothetical protein